MDRFIAVKIWPQRILRKKYRRRREKNQKRPAVRLTCSRAALGPSLGLGGATRQIGLMVDCSDRFLLRLLAWAACFGHTATI